MNKPVTTLMQGAHRGATTLVERLPPTALSALGPHLRVADPHPARADVLATRAQRRFPTLAVSADERAGDAVLPMLSPDATLLLASDTPAGILDTLARREDPQGTLWQLVGRGPGGAAGRRFGIQGTIVPRDTDGAYASAALLDALRRAAPPASSRAMTATDPLTAQVLAPLRDAVAAQSAAQLSMLSRAPWDLPHGPLTLHGAVVPYPVAVRVVPEIVPSERRARVLDAVDDVPLSQRADRGALGRFVVIALVAVDLGRVAFHTVSVRAGDRRRIDGVAEIAPEPEALRAPVFTD